MSQNHHPLFPRKCNKTTQPLAPFYDQIIYYLVSYRCLLHNLHADNKTESCPFRRLDSLATLHLPSPSATQLYLHTLNETASSCDRVINNYLCRPAFKDLRFSISPRITYPTYRPCAFHIVSFSRLWKNFISFNCSRAIRKKSVSQRNRCVPSSSSRRRET